MYKITFTNSAAKLFKKIDKKIQHQIISYFDRQELLKNPKTFGKALLYEQKGNWRYRVGGYRIICKILDGEMVILIIDIGHRKEIYK